MDREGFEPPKSIDSRFTVCPRWPLGYLWLGKILYNKNMLLIIRKKATDDEIKEISEDYQGYIKLIIDMEKEILTGGGERHFDGEQALLKEGSKQKNLWGGGIDWETKEIDYNSIINLRPNQNNPSRDILSTDIRKKFNAVVKKLLL